MKLFVVVLGSLLTIGVLSWMTLSLEKIQVHRDEMRRAQQWSDQRTHGS